MALDVYKDWLGIPEGPRPPDHYQLLRLIEFEDDEEKIRSNHRKLNGHVRKYASGPYSADSQSLLNEMAKALLCLTDKNRKRQYDESLGREFEEEPDEFGRKPLDRVLIDQGLLSSEQVEEAESFADARGLSLRDAVVQMKLLDAERAARALAMHLGLSYVDLDETIPDDSALDKVPRSVVKRNSIIPLFDDDGMLMVACVDQPEHELEEEMQLRFGVPMRAVIATPLAINQAIAKYYAHGLRDESVIEEVKTSGKSAKAKTHKAKNAGQPRKRISQLSDEEKAERKQKGILIMCGVTSGSVVIDMLLLSQLSFVRALFFPLNMYLLTLILPPLVIAWVVRVYWK